MTTTSIRNERTATSQALPTNWVETGFSPLWLVLQTGIAMVKGLKRLRSKS